MDWNSATAVALFLIFAAVVFVAFYSGHRAKQDPPEDRHYADNLFARGVLELRRKISWWYWLGRSLDTAFGMVCFAFALHALGQEEPVVALVYVIGPIAYRAIWPDYPPWPR